MAKALDEWSDLHQLRALLCHGSGVVTIDEGGRWHMTLRLLNFRGGKVERDTLVLDEDEAAEGLHMLQNARQRLEGQLEGLMAGLLR